MAVCGSRSVRSHRMGSERSGPQAEVCAAGQGSCAGSCVPAGEMCAARQHLGRLRVSGRGG